MGKLLFAVYALLITIVGATLGEVGLFWLPFITIIVIVLFDPLGKLK